MLKIDEGKIEVHGGQVQLQAELTQLMESLLEHDVLSKEDLQKCVDTAIQPLSDIIQDIIQKICEDDDLFEKFTKFLEEQITD